MSNAASAAQAAAVQQAAQSAAATYTTPSQAAAAAPVQAVNGKTGSVAVPVPSDGSAPVSAAQAAAVAPVQSVNAQVGAVTVATGQTAAQVQTAITSATSGLATQSQLAAQNVQLPGSYTIAGLPAASSNANMQAVVTDLGGGQGIVVADGTNGCWRSRSPLSRYQTLSADTNGSLTYLTNADVVYATGGLTAPRTWSITTTNACRGAVIRVVRTFTAGDTNTLMVNGLNLPNGSSLDLHYDGTAWQIGSATANRLQWAQTCSLTTTGGLSVATFTYPQPYPTGTVPQVVCTVQAASGSTQLFNCQANGSPNNTSATFAVNYVPTASVSLTGLVSLNLFQAAPTNTCVTMVARQPG